MRVQEAQDSVAFFRWNVIDLGRKGVIHIDQFFAAFGMAYDNRMARRRCARAKDTGPVMERSQPVEIGFHPVRQGVIGGVHAGENRVSAAIWRNRMIIENTAEGWELGAGLVRMPDITRYFRCGFVIVEKPYSRVFSRIADGFDTDMRADGPEILRQPDMVFKADFLISEEYNKVIGKCAPQLRDLPVGERPCQVDPAYFCTDIRGAGRDRYLIVGGIKSGIGIQGFGHGSTFSV